MDSDSLRLAGIRSPIDQAPPQPAKQIIKPAWLTRNITPGDPLPEAPTLPTTAQTTSPTTTEAPIRASGTAEKRTKKRKNSVTATSTPKTSKPNTRSNSNISSPITLDDEEMPDPEESSKVPDPFEKLQKYMGEQLKQISSEMSGLRGEVGSSVDKIATQVKTNTDNIAMLQKDMADMSGKIKEQVQETIAKELRRHNPDPRTTPNMDDYMRCRRSVRCWPIKGPNTELWGLTGDFFRDVLEIPLEDLPQTSVQSIRRLSTPRSNKPSKVRFEVLVTFVDVSTRDMIFSYAPNLAKHRNQPCPPGIRIEYPDSLRGEFQILEKYGAMMRGELGASFKRSIKFDDGTNGLRIDVCFPGDTTWTKIPTEVAREEIQKRQQCETKAARERIGSLSSQQGNQLEEQPRANLMPSSSTLVRLHNPAPPRRWGQNN